MNQYRNLTFYAAAAGVALLFFYFLSPILPPFLIGMALAYLGDPICDRLQRWKLSRTVAVTLVFAVMVLVAVVCLLILVPLIEGQLRVAIASIPAAVEKINSTLIPWINTTLGVQLPPLNMASISDGVKSYWQELGGVLGIVAGWLGNSTQVLFALVAVATVTPVVSFYLLRDWDLLMARLHDLLPRRIEPQVVRLASEMDSVLAEFVRGQLLLMLVQSIYFSIGLALVGLNLALLIGLVAGVFSFVPYLGLIIGMGSALIAAAIQFQELLPIVLVLVVFGIGQVLESVLLQPLLVGDRIGMHPVAVIFAVMAGGQLFGFVGVLLALPVAAVITVLLRHIRDFYKSSDMYRSSRPLNPSTGIPADLQQPDD